MRRRSLGFTTNYSAVNYGVISSWWASFTVSPDANTIEALGKRGSDTDYQTYTHDR